MLLRDTNRNRETGIGIGTCIFFEYNRNHSVITKIGNIPGRRSDYLRVSALYMGRREGPAWADALKPPPKPESSESSRSYFFKKAGPPIACAATSTAFAARIFWQFSGG